MGKSSVAQVLANFNQYLDDLSSIRLQRSLVVLIFGLINWKYSTMLISTSRSAWILVPMVFYLGHIGGVVLGLEIIIGPGPIFGGSGGGGGDEGGSSSSEQMRVGFYSESCPNVEAIVRSTVKFYLTRDSSTAAGLLRLFFHDCFVQGCDGSVLIDGPSSERRSPKNVGLHGFDVIDDAKLRLETQCPGIVSCVDILALAVRDAIVLRGGPTWNVTTGRLDGLDSDASNVDMPSPMDSLNDIIHTFSSKGLSTKDMVALSGAHTLGKATCGFFSYRLYNFRATRSPYPAANEQYLVELRSQCPANGDGNVAISLDKGSEMAFDNSFFMNLKKGNGLLESDQMLATNPSTAGFVDLFAGDVKTFQESFIESMKKMSLIDVLYGDDDGEIRGHCSSFN